MIGCLALVIVGGVIIAVVVGGVFLLGFNEYADTTESEGVEFGRKTDQQGCQSEAFRRLRQARRLGKPDRSSGHFVVSGWSLSDLPANA